MKCLNYARAKFRRFQDRHCLFEECRDCGEELIFMGAHTTTEQIEAAKALHVCGVACAA